jgi:hypothetical protein
MADVTNVAAVPGSCRWPDGTMMPTRGVARRTIPAGVEVYEVTAPSFAAADKIKDVSVVATRPKVSILGCATCRSWTPGIRVLDDLFQSFSPGIRFDRRLRRSLGALDRAGRLILRAREHRGSLTRRCPARAFRAPPEGRPTSGPGDVPKSWDGESLVREGH